MQRVRIGLTGLAFVFLAVLLAAVFTSEPAGEPPITPNLIDQQQNGTAPAQIPPEAIPAEPLAELGVAPGKAEENNVQPPPAPPQPAGR